LKKHAVHFLFKTRLSQSTKPFKARGGSVERCEYCRIDQRFCICELRPSLESNAAFLLLYYDDEVLKPSNTGRLIADLFTDTYAYIWKRTEVDSALLALLSDPRWYPVIVFPDEYAEPGREVIHETPKVRTGARPLFILLDGSWREAKKMFRKSPYLDSFPVLSVNAEDTSRYLMRKATRDHQLATAEVASFVLDSAGEVYNAEVLRAWFDLFSFRYQKGVQRKNLGDQNAESRLISLILTSQPKFSAECLCFSLTIRSSCHTSSPSSDFALKMNHLYQVTFLLLKRIQYAFVGIAKSGSNLIMRLLFYCQVLSEIIDSVISLNIDKKMELLNNESFSGFINHAYSTNTGFR
jgi:DTW domain-containing protein YfiP